MDNHSQSNKNEGKKIRSSRGKTTIIYQNSGIKSPKVTKIQESNPQIGIFGFMFGKSW